MVSSYHQLRPLRQASTRQQSRRRAARLTCKDAGKVLSLPRICHVDDPVPLLVVQALLDGCHVRGSVSKAAVRFLDHQGRLPRLHIQQEAEVTLTLADMLDLAIKSVGARAEHYMEAREHAASLLSSSRTARGQLPRMHRTMHMAMVTPRMLDMIARD